MDLHEELLRGVDRRGTHCFKWDSTPEGVIPMFVADMDFPCAEGIMDALRRRLEHPALGYTMHDDADDTALIDYYFRHHGVSVKPEDLRGFQMESKRYGGLFYPIINRVEKTGTVEIMAKAKDARQINRIFERMGYPAPVREDDTAKKANPRARSESSFRERGNGARTSTEMDKPSVRAKMLELKKVSEQMARQAKAVPVQENEQIK